MLFTLIFDAAACMSAAKLRAWGRYMWPAEGIIDEIWYHGYQLDGLGENKKEGYHESVHSV
jgi:hypothetical protein